MERPAVEGLRDGLVALAHAGRVRSWGQTSNCILTHRVSLNRFVKRCICRIQLRFIHRDVLDITFRLFVVDLVDMISIRFSRDVTVITNIIAIIYHERIERCREIKDTLSGGILCTCHSILDRYQVTRFRVVQFKPNIAGSLIFELDFIGSLQPAGPDCGFIKRLGQRIDQRIVLQRRGADHHVCLTDTVAGESDVLVGEIVLHSRAFRVRLQDDRGSRFGEAVGDDGVHDVRHFVGCDRRAMFVSIADTIKREAGDKVRDAVLGVLDLCARSGSLGDQLGVLIKRVRSHRITVRRFRHDYKFDGVLHELGNRYGLIVELHGLIAIGVVHRDELRIWLLGSLERRARQRVAIEHRRLNGDLFAFLERVAGLIASGHRQGRVAMRGVDQFNRDGLLTAIQLIQELDHCGIIVRRPRPIPLTGDRLITHAPHIRYFDRRLRAADGGHGVGLEDFRISIAILVALEVHRHGDVAGILVLAIPEGDGLVTPVLHEVGGGVAVRHCCVASGRGHLSKEPVALADFKAGKLLSLLLSVDGDLISAVCVLLDNRDGLRLAGVLVGHLDIAHTVIGVVGKVRHRRVVDRNRCGSSSTLVILDGGCCGIAGEGNCGTFRHGAAVLAVQPMLILIHRDHCHVAGILGVNELDDIVVPGWRIGPAGLICRVARNARSLHGSRYVFFQQRLVALQLRAVIGSLDRHLNHLVRVGEHDVDLTVLASG